MTSQLTKCIQSVNSARQQLVGALTEAERVVRYYNANGLATEVAAAPDALSASAPQMSKQEFLDTLTLLASALRLLWAKAGAGGNTLLGTPSLMPPEAAAYVDKLAV